MTTVEVFAPAKINLSLHITGQRDDGYHELDSLVVFATDVGDHLVVGPSNTLTLAVDGPMSDCVPTNESNLVLRAAQLLQSTRGVTAGAAISLTKHLPNGAGIGGGSSDAAAAIKALATMWDVAPLTASEALPLGADLPVCMHAPAPAHMSGIGEIIEPVQTLPPFWLVLVNPGIVVPTSTVFQRLSQHFSVDNPPMEPLDSHASFELALYAMRNDLTMCMYDFKMEVLEAISAMRPMTSCIKENMSGSGSTCWGLFFSEADARDAAVKLTASHPKWWVRATGVS